MNKAEQLKKSRVDEMLDMPDTKFVNFRGGTLISHPDSYGFEPLTDDVFARTAYRAFSTGIARAQITDLMHAVSATAPDWSHTKHLIAFRDQVWDMTALDFDANAIEMVYSSPIAPNPAHTAKPKQFLLELAKGDQALADDYLQAIAPLFMTKRPSGIVWFIGDGANGKSTLLKAVSEIIGKHLVNHTVAAIEDGRDLIDMAGCLGNVCTESSEQRVEDSEKYKAIGTHEPFPVRKFYAQNPITIDGDFHTIFNANTIPVFSDKTKGARRRTLPVPFPAHFTDDPTFEERTLTPEFLSGLLHLILEAAKKIRDNGYKYKWSEATLALKSSYDSEVNSAEAFVDYLKDSKVVGFFNYAILKLNYETWCAHNGLIPLGMTQLKRTVTTDTGAERKSVRLDDGKTVKRYFFSGVYAENLVWLDNGYGLMPSTELEQTMEETENASLGDW